MFMQCFKHVAEDRTNETHIVPVQVFNQLQWDKLVSSSSFFYNIVYSYVTMEYSSSSLQRIAEII